MDFENNSLKVERVLLDEALSKGIDKNEKQYAIWRAYKRGHQEVAQALHTFQKDLYVNCMIPIGKRALIKGKLIHTNEVLVCLGGEYFAKYSTAGATALCERRIKRAEEMLDNLSAERDLFEKKVMVIENDIFEDCAGREIVEYCNEDQIAEWKKTHRQREREYHQKLAKLRQTEEKKIETEDDLFNRLDRLEIEEELADELHRLEDEKYKLFGEELDTDESYYDLESEEEEEEEEEEEVEEEEAEGAEEEEEDGLIEKQNECSNDKNDADILRLEFKYSDNNPTVKSDECVVKTSADNCRINVEEKEEKKEQCGKETSQEVLEETVETVQVKKSVSFAESEYILNKTEDGLIEKENECSNDKNDADILRIEFTHSDNNPTVKSDGCVVETPADIYRIFSKPKSILKRLPNDNPQQAAFSEFNVEEEEEDEETEEGFKPSAYNIVVKDIKERNTAVIANEDSASKEGNETRPVSKFKRDRQQRKN